MDFAGFKDNDIFYYEATGVTKNMINMTAHYHNLYEVYFLESGSCSYFVENKLFEVRAGDTVLIPKDVIHKTMYRNEPHSRLLINCSGYFIPSSVKTILFKKVRLYRNCKTAEQLHSIFKDIENEYTHSDDFSQEMIRSHMHMLFILLARNSTVSDGEPAQTGYIYEIVDYIHKNYCSSITLSMMSEKYSVSQEHISRMFRRETGIGFNEYITLMRLREAERLLKDDTKRTISEIAYSCGFNDSNYFSAKFKSVYGLPPKVFSRQ